MKGTNMETPTLDEICKGFEQSYTPAITDILDFEFDLHNQWLGGEIRPLVPEMHVAGPAFTVRWVNDRTPATEKQRTIVADMIDHFYPLALPIIDTSKNMNCGYWGELVCNICKEKGIHGTVIDGGVRDPYYIWRFGFNMFAAFACPNEADTRSRLESFQEPIAINNVAVRPGDFVVGDFGGVVVVPQELVPDVYRKVQALTTKESRFREIISKGITGEGAVRTFGRSL
jgi:regulator of RNase E activity RraA